MVAVSGLLPTSGSRSGRSPRPAWLLAALLAVPVAGLAGCRSAAPRPSTTRRVAPAEPARALVAEGDAARRDGRLAEAAELYRRAIAADPTLVPAHVRCVETLVAAGERRNALDFYAARAAAPGAATVDRVMAARLASDGSAAAVRTVYVNAAKAEPANPWWRLALAEVDLAAAERALAARDAARTAGDRPRAETYDLRVRTALARAQSAVEHASERDDGLPEVSLYRGLVRSFEADLLGGGSARLAAYKAATEAFRRATTLDPDLVDAWANLGDVSLRAGDLPAAIVAYQTAVRLSPQDADLREGLGLALHDAERHADAAAQYAEAARLRPRDGRPLLSVGDSWAATGDMQRALAAYDQALVRDPTTVEAYAKRGAALERLGRLAEAREAYAIYVEKDGRESADVKRRIERILAPTASTR